MATPTQEIEKTPEKTTQQAPVQHYPSVFEEMDRWFEDTFQRNWMMPFFRRGWRDWPEFGAGLSIGKPRVDIIDRPEEILVRAELPGVTKDDLEVTLGDNSLTIRATTKQEKKEETEQFFRRELCRGEFQRTIELPYGVDGDKAKTCFKDGVLELTLPKAEGAKRKSIKIE